MEWILPNDFRKMEDFKLESRFWDPNLHLAPLQLLLGGGHTWILYSSISGWWNKWMAFTNNFGQTKVFTPCGIIFPKKNRKENHLPEARVVEPRFPGKPNINNNYQIHKSTFLVENGFCWSSSGFVTTYNGHIHCLISGLKPYTRLSKSRKM